MPVYLPTSRYAHINQIVVNIKLQKEEKAVDLEVKEVAPEEYGAYIHFLDNFFIPLEEYDESVSYNESYLEERVIFEPVEDETLRAIEKILTDMKDSLLDSTFESYFEPCDGLMEWVEAHLRHYLVEEVPEMMGVNIYLPEDVQTNTNVEFEWMSTEKGDPLDGSFEFECDEEGSTTMIEAKLPFLLWRSITFYIAA